MKLKNVFLMSLLVILTTAIPGFTANNYAHVYDGVLRNYWQLIADRSDENVNIDGTVGILEAIAGKKKDAALNSVGYAIEDVSGDGIPELLIGAVTKRKGSVCMGSRIYAVYTCVKGTPRFSFEGWARNSLDFMGGGRFFRQGSNGAMYSMFGTYTISKDGASLRCKDYYFTFEKDKNFKRIGFYHNTSGKWDKSASEELKISAADFSQIEKKLLKQITPVELIPFSQYKTTTAEVRPVRAQWAKDVLSKISVYDSFIPKPTGPQVKIVFSALSKVTNFRVLALTPVEKNAAITFTEKTLYVKGTLTPERPLVVGVTFHGDLPNNGISYVDRNGRTMRFAVSESGEDGSLLLTTF